MIEKLYKLKKNQTDQKLMQKAQIMSKIEQLDIEITREKVTLKSVSSTTYLSNDKKVGYIYISLF